MKQTEFKAKARTQAIDDDDMEIILTFPAKRKRNKRKSCDDQQYMNTHTGSVDTLAGWYPYTPENDGLVPVVWDKKEKTWVEA